MKLIKIDFSNMGDYNHKNEIERLFNFTENDYDTYYESVMDNFIYLCDTYDVFYYNASNQKQYRENELEYLKVLKNNESTIFYFIAYDFEMATHRINAIMPCVETIFY